MIYEVWVDGGAGGTWLEEENSEERRKESIESGCRLIDSFVANSYEEAKSLYEKKWVYKYSGLEVLDRIAQTVLISAEKLLSQPSQK